MIWNSCNFQGNPFEGVLSHPLVMFRIMNILGDIFFYCIFVVTYCHLCPLPPLTGGALSTFRRALLGPVLAAGQVNFLPAGQLAPSTNLDELLRPSTSSPLWPIHSLLPFKPTSAHIFVQDNDIWMSIRYRASWVLSITCLSIFHYYAQGGLSIQHHVFEHQASV